MTTLEITRFRIFDSYHQSRKFEADTLVEIWDWLSKHGDIENYFIDDVVDDIEVTADDFMAAWENGERPKDLQMF